MTELNINKVGVVGSGTMGSGIAQLIASNDMQVCLLDITKDTAELALQKMEKALRRLVSRDKLTADEADKIVSAIHTTENYADLQSAQMVIEAVSEDLSVKKAVFEKIEKNTDEGSIIATNTSTLPVTELAMRTGRPERVVGIHFFNPASVMKLTEIVQTEKTSPETMKRAMDFVKGLGKYPIVVKDRAGFVVNRILLPMINEAVFALEEGVASAQDIDTAMKLGANHPMGPLSLADLIGLDVTLDVLSVLYQEFGDPKFRPAPLLKEMVRLSYLGRKSGRGFFEYSK